MIYQNVYDENEVLINFTLIKRFQSRYCIYRKLFSFRNSLHRHIQEKHEIIKIIVFFVTKSSIIIVIKNTNNVNNINNIEKPFANEQSLTTIA